MMRAIKVENAGAWPREDAAGRVTLPYDDRHRRRMRLVADDGTDFLLDLGFGMYKDVLLEEGYDTLWMIANADTAELDQLTVGGQKAMKKAHVRAIVGQAKERWELICGTKGGGAGP